MDYKPWMNRIKPEYMPNGDLKFVAEFAGIKSALALLFCAPGLTVSIPQKPFKELKEQYIMDNYDGTKYSINKLAVECGISQRYVYKIIERNLKKKPPPDTTSDKK